MKRNPPAIRFVLALTLLGSCTSFPMPASGTARQLATTTENFVTVTISLDADTAGQTWLAAAFIPEDPQFHLYGKDLPRKGIDGLGRPTLLELAPGSLLQTLGPLSDSVPAEHGKGPAGLLIYPAGPVILRLPVRIPDGTGWFDDRVSVTYMACSGTLCKTPVEGKLIPIRVPRTIP